MPVLRAALLAATLVAVSITGASAGASGSTPETWQQPTPITYGHTTVADLAIRMSDGVTLVGDVLYPTDLASGHRAPGMFPVLLTQNPYRCDTTRTNIDFLDGGGLGATYYVERGYVFASVCVRGTGRSGGEFDLFGPRQQRDGVELVAWVVHRLDGSNGTAGLIGCSYLGANQLFTAAALPPGSGVKAMLPACVGAELYRGVGFAGGMPTQTSLNLFRAFGQLMGPRAGAWGAAQAQRIESGGPEAYETAWNTIRTPGNWAQQIVSADIPALLWTGYEDMYPMGAQEMYAYLQNAYFHRSTHDPMRPGQPTTPRYQVIVGPGGHGEGIDRTIALHWFDTWLKGHRTGMDRTATPMHLYQLGSATWVNTASFPTVRAYTPYHLSTGARLTTAEPKALGTEPIRYTQPTMDGGTLTYTSEPFASGATLAGPISASLVASSTSTNLNLIATLFDVAPGGTATRLTSGSIVGSLRALDTSRSWYDQHGVVIRPYGSFTADQPMRPGRDYELTFPMSARIAQLAPGHALRLTLTTQTPPQRCAPTIITGVDPCFPTASQQATLPGTYHVRLGLSKVNLPLLPYQWR